jgi:hypothetical protein
VSGTADTQFRDATVIDVRKELGRGFSITCDDGWSFFVPVDSPISPRPGMTARFFGRGVGYSVRGLFLDGIKVFYRSASEQVEHEEIELYGRDASDWLARWDGGRNVFSIAMGGLGPGYEQAIQMTVAEMLRVMIAGKFVAARWSDPEAWKRDRLNIDKALNGNPVVDRLGLSGAQFGAALSLASSLYSRGPRNVLPDPALKGRSIQVSKNFPGSSL